MKVLDAVAKATTLASLAGLLGCRRWLLDLGANIFHVEYMTPRGEIIAAVFAMGELESQHDPSDLKAFLAHIQSAAGKGQVTPEVLTFSPDGMRKIKAISVCEIVRNEGSAYIFGLYREQEDDSTAVQRLNLLGDYLDSFIQHSPSCTMVINNVGRVVSTNHALGAFLRIHDHRSLIGHSISDVSPMFDSKLVVIVKAALLAPGASKGRHIITHATGLVQSIYWRCFPLTLKSDPSGTRVFAFDPSAAGPTDKIS